MTPFLFNQSVHYLFCLSYIISLAKERKATLKSWRFFPLRNAMILVFLGFILVIIMDGRPNFGHYLNTGITIFITNYLPLFLGFSSLQTRTDIKKVLKLLFIIAIIQSVYSLFVYLTGTNPYDNYQSSFVKIDENIDFVANTDSVRGVRINSFIANSHVFGYFMSVLFLIIFAYRKRIKKIISILLILLVLASLILSKSRSSIICAFIGICTIYIFSVNQRKTFQRIMILACSIIILLVFQNDIFDHIPLISDAFKEDGGKVGGSNVVMRQGQFNSVLPFFIKNPIWGNGIGFFRDNILDTKYYVSEMAGVESYIYTLLMEYGTIFMSILGYYLYACGRFIFSSISTCKLEASLAFALFISFWFNAFVTGDAGKWLYVMPLIGILIKYIELTKKLKIEKIKIS